MTYDEAKIETFDKLLPRQGERFRLIHECGGSMGTMEISLMRFWTKLAEESLVLR